MIAPLKPTNTVAHNQQILWYAQRDGRYQVLTYVHAAQQPQQKHQITAMSQRHMEHAHQPLKHANACVPLPRIRVVKK